MADATEVVAEEKKALEGAETEAPKAEVKPATTLEEALKRVADLEAERQKDEELLKKLRRFEKENKTAAEKALAEQGKFRELYEAEKAKREEVEAKAKTKAIDAVLQEALKEAKAKSVSTVLKLVDRSKVTVDEHGEVDAKSVKDLIKEIQKSDPILFEDAASAAAPQVKRATEGEAVGGYEKEMRAAKTPQEIQKVLEKYGKM